MRDKIREIEQAALGEIEAARDNKESLEGLRIKYLGRKGIVTELFKKIGGLSADEKRDMGQLLNVLKNTVTKALDERIVSASAKEEANERIDITLPGISPRVGKTHPITKTISEICDIFIGLGFKVVEGPEIETEYYNFEALNIPLEHPSRDAFDTFYIKVAGSPVSQLASATKIGGSAKVFGGSSTGKPANRQTGKPLLRSHTSPVQTRFMEKNEPPFSIVVPGKVFRPDATDASHSFMFHQIEGLVVGEDIRFSDLKGALSIFAKQMFGESTRMRFRPSFFPFTEPSAEVDISCVICSNKGSRVLEFARSRPETHELTNPRTGELKRCSVCGGKGWLEILGAGMVNPKVFKKVGYNPERFTGFAFGMGVERIAMLKYGINDIRLFFENDVRFLRQF